MTPHLCDNCDNDCDCGFEPDECVYCDACRTDNDEDEPDEDDEEESDEDEEEAESDDEPGYGL